MFLEDFVVHALGVWYAELLGPFFDAIRLVVRYYEIEELGDKCNVYFGWTWVAVVAVHAVPRPAYFREVRECLGVVALALRRVAVRDALCQLSFVSSS